MTTSVLMAAFGGFTINILQLLEYSKLPKNERPEFRDWLFWLPYVVWPVLGAVLAFAYLESGIEISAILGFNIGLSAPLILRAMVESNPVRNNVIDPGKGA